MKAKPEIESNLKNSITNAIGEFYQAEITALEIITAEIVKDPYPVFTESSRWTVSVTGASHSTEDIRIIQDKPWMNIEYIYSARHGLSRSRISVEHGVVLVGVMIRHTHDFGEPVLIFGAGILDSKGDVEKLFITANSDLYLQPDWDKNSIALTTFEKANETFSKNLWRYLNTTSNQK